MEKIEGIVINSYKYKENSKLINILTEDDYLTLLVKATCNYESKNFSGSQELILINFEMHKSEKQTFSILKTYEIINNYKHIKKNYEVIIEVMEILKIVHYYHEHIISYKNLFSLLRFCLNNIDLLSSFEYINLSKIKFYKILFYTKLLYLLGVGPNFKNCTTCNSKNAYNFSIELGGLVCDKCTALDKLSGEYIGLLKVLYLGKIDMFTIEMVDSLPFDYDRIIKLLKKYYEKYLSIKIN